MKSLVIISAALVRRETDAKDNSVPGEQSVQLHLLYAHVLYCSQQILFGAYGLNALGELPCI